MNDNNTPSVDRSDYWNCQERVGGNAAQGVRETWTEASQGFPWGLSLDYGAGIKVNGGSAGTPQAALSGAQLH